MKRLLIFLLFTLVAPSITLSEEPERTSTLNGARITGSFIEDKGDKTAIPIDSGKATEVTGANPGKDDIEHISSPRTEPTVVPQDENRLSAETPLPLLNKDFFGIRLGGNINSLRRICATNNISIETNKFPFAIKDHPGLRLSFYGAVEGGEIVYETVLSLFDNQIYAADFYLKDASESDYYEFQKALANNYNMNPEPREERQELRSEYETTIGYRKVKIFLRQRGGNKPALIISYVYDALADRVLREINRREAAKAERTGRSARIFDSSYSW